MARHPSFAYTGPFLVFIALLAMQDHLAFLGAFEQPLRVVILGFSIWFFSRSVLTFQVARPALAIAIGVAVFLIWIGPDQLMPGYRDHWLFQNPVLGHLKSSLRPELRSDPVTLVFRFVRAAVIVPILEELFWRGWLMRWLIRADFESVPLGSYDPRAFWLAAILFAVEHGPYWEVGLLAGIAYNWLVVRARTLGDCILAHAITNAALSAWVIATAQWQYWM